MHHNFKNQFKISDFSKVELVIFDFDGVFTDNTVYVSDQGIEVVRCWRSDGLGIRRLKDCNTQIYVVSTELNPVVSVRAKKLGIPYKQGVSNKALAVCAICEELNIKAQDAVFLGNDINDIPAFMTVGFPVAVRDAYPEVLHYVKYRTKAPGGFGAVRELCDIVYQSKTAMA